MKILNLLLTALSGASAAVTVGYFMFQQGSGLFTKLPAPITDFMLQHDWLKYVALVVLVGSLLANLLISAARRRQKSENRV